MVRLGRALNECKGRAEADTVAEVIVSQVCLLDTARCSKGAENAAVLVAVATVSSAAARTSTCVAVQINRGVLTYLSNNEQGPEKLVVILDCRGATAMQVSHLLHQVV